MAPNELALRTRSTRGTAAKLASVLPLQTSVPFEILRMILLECFEDKALLAQWCLVSFETLQVAGPLLYEDVQPRSFKRAERERMDQLKKLFQLKVRPHLLPLPPVRPTRD